jgi:cytochrome c-type biogenesis protein CcmH/NrfF
LLLIVSRHKPVSEEINKMIWLIPLLVVLLMNGFLYYRKKKAAATADG